MEKKGTIHIIKDVHNKIMIIRYSWKNIFDGINKNIMKKK